MASQNDSHREQVSILGPTLRFKGELHADEDLMVRGRVEGSITHSQRLTVCREGQVKGDIAGQVIAVEGTVEGDLRATKSISVASTAHLRGDVSAPSVSIVEGANFNGGVLMDGNGSSSSSRGTDGSSTQSDVAPNGAVTR